MDKGLNMYLDLIDQTQFRLKTINEIKDCLLLKFGEKLMCKRLKDLVNILPPLTILI